MALASFMSSQWGALATAMARVAKIVHSPLGTKAIIVSIGNSTEATSSPGAHALQALWSFVPVTTL